MSTLHEISESALAPQEETGEKSSLPVSQDDALDEEGPSVLLVEDNFVNQKVALRMLKSLNVEADVAKNGLEAVEKTEKNSYKLVFMDIQMPEMDGYAATRSIRARDGDDSELKIVGLTAFAMKGDRERCLEAGMDDYIAKPFQKEDIRRVLEAYHALPSV